MQTPIDLFALAGQPRESVVAVIPLDDEDGVDAWGPFHEFVAYFDDNGRLTGGHVFFNEPQASAEALALLAEFLNVRTGDHCAVTLHPCVFRPEIITGRFTLTF